MSHTPLHSERYADLPAELFDGLMFAAFERLHIAFRLLLKSIEDWAKRWIR